MRAQNAKTRYNILMDYNKLALKLHQKYKGKITTALRDSGEIDRDKLSSYYSPGIGAVSHGVVAAPELEELEADHEYQQRDEELDGQTFVGGCD